MVNPVAELVAGDSHTGALLGINGEESSASLS